MAAPIPITWTSSYTQVPNGVGGPGYFCAYLHAGVADHVTFGWKRSFFRCGKSDGTYTQVYDMFADCPVETRPDFQSLTCIPTNEGLEQLLNLSLDDGVILVSSILGLWAIAYGIRQVARSINTTPERFENE